MESSFCGSRGIAAASRMFVRFAMIAIGLQGMLAGPSAIMGHPPLPPLVTPLLCCGGGVLYVLRVLLLRFGFRLFAFG